MSSRLTSEARVYAEKARDLNRQVSMEYMKEWGNLGDFKPEKFFI